MDNEAIVQEIMERVDAAVLALDLLDADSVMHMIMEECQVRRTAYREDDPYLFEDAD